jgi:hypothetical protein
MSKSSDKREAIQREAVQEEKDLEKNTKITPKTMIKTGDRLGTIAIHAINLESVGSKEYLVKCIRGLLEEIGEQDWNDYTQEELIAIGFKPLIKMKKNQLLLLAPLFLLKCTRKGFKLDSISGDTTEYTKDFKDHDTRNGVTAYGLLIKE